MEMPLSGDWRKGALDADKTLKGNTLLQLIRRTVTEIELSCFNTPKGNTLLQLPDGSSRKTAVFKLFQYPKG